MISLKKAVDKFLRLLYPHRCPICGEIPPSSDAPQLCPDCAVLFASELSIRCPDCRLPAPQCLCTPKKLTDVVSEVNGRQFLCTSFYQPGVKSSVVNKLIYAVKYNADDTAVRIFAQMLSREILLHFHKAGKPIGECIITYPPRSRNAKRRIGFDQARRLARLCAEYTGAQYASLFTRQGGKEQKNLRHAERIQNAENAFRLNNPQACRGKCVILCDDVLTTGATLSACAALLKQAGANEIIIAAAAKTVSKARTKSSSAQDVWFQK